MLLLGKLTISMAIFNSFLLVYQRVGIHFFEQHSLDPIQREPMRISQISHVQTTSKCPG